MTGPTEPRRTPASETEAGEPFAEFVYRTLEEKRAEDVVWLDLTGLTDLADAMMIATVTSKPQSRAIVEECEKERKRRGLKRLSLEGEAGSSWVLLDYGDLIVHLQMPEQRAYYALEHLWADAKRIK